MSRPVKIMSVALKPRDGASLIAALTGALHEGLDLVVLPETCLSDQTDGGAQMDADVIKAMQKAAAGYKVNIVFPLYTAIGDVKRINTALVINREGAIAGAYRKIYPYWSEYDMDPPCAVTNGGDCVVELDFGKIGLAICFDSNFTDVWQNLYDSGAELVVWSSAYSAGMQLAAYSLIHHYPIVTCTQVPDVAVFDIDGREVLYKKGEDVCGVEYTVDLDRCIFHHNFNQDKAQQLLAEHGQDVEIEKDYWREEWFILRSKNESVSARELAAKYKMTELKAYQNNSRDSINAMRITV